MDRDNLVGVIVIAYIACLAGYVGWRLAQRTALRDARDAQVREDIWNLSARLRKLEPAPEAPSEVAHES